MCERALAVALCFVTAAGAMALPARAAAQEGRCIEKLTDAEVASRYQTIEGAFEDEQLHARLWYFGWLSAFAGLATGNAILAGLDTGGHRPRYLVSMVGSALSVLSFTILPRTGLDASFAVRRLRRMPDATLAQRRARLRYAEHLLADSAKRQALGSSLLSQSTGFVWGLGSGLLLGLRYHDTLGAVLLALGSPAINELRVFTGPRASMRAWERYRGTANNCMAPALRELPPETGPSVDLSAGPGRIALTVRW